MIRKMPFVCICKGCFCFADQRYIARFYNEQVQIGLTNGGVGYII